MNNDGFDGTGIKMEYVHLGSLNMSLIMILMRSTGVSLRSSDLVQ